MIYQGLKSTTLMLLRVHPAGANVGVSSRLSVFSLAILTIVVVVARHGCLPPREHRVAWNCALLWALAAFVVPFGVHLSRTWPFY